MPEIRLFASYRGTVARGGGINPVGVFKVKVRPADFEEAPTKMKVYPLDEPEPTLSFPGKVLKLLVRVFIVPVSTQKGKPSKEQGRIVHRSSKL